MLRVGNCWRRGEAMSEPTQASILKFFKTLLFALVILTLGMGIGRFLYTPLLPVMLDEGLLTFDQLSYIASANYAGYLAGSLCFSFGRLGHHSLASRMLFGAAVATIILIGAMAFTTNVYLVVVIRFAAGVASAAMMIFGSMAVMQHTHDIRIIAALYAGVGAGIALGNEYVIIGLRHMLTAQSLWLGAGVISVLLLLLLVILSPNGNERTGVAPSAALIDEKIVWWQLALLYGLAGYGYINVATYLPLMAKAFRYPLIASHLWSLVGLAIIPGCFLWLRAARRWDTLPCLTVNLVIQAVCVLLMTLSAGSPFLLIFSCVGFGATFMGTTSLVMPFARRLRAPYGINLIGLVTLTYGVGQILGPLLASLAARVLPFGAEAVAPSVVCAAAALFAASIISQRCVVKKPIGI